jgi:hypothetical protein
MQSTYTGTIKPGDVPAFLWRANPHAGRTQLVDLYRNYLSQNPNSRWHRQLTRRYGPGSPAGSTPAPGGTAGGTSVPGATAPPASGPVKPNFQPQPPTPQPQLTPPLPAPWNPATPPSVSSGMTDIYDVYKAAIPVMEKDRNDQISQAMAHAGFSGNRYSSSAMNSAGEIGAQTALRQNQLLTSLIHDQGNRDLDRALAATNTSIQLAGVQDEMERNRLNTLFDFGRYEQSRQDDLARLAYADWNQNKFGLLPLLIQFAGSQSGGQAPTPYAVTQPGTTGAADWLTLFSQLFS